MNKIAAKILSYKVDHRLLWTLKIVGITAIVIGVYQETGFSTASAVGILFMILEFLAWAVNKVTRLLLQLVNQLNSEQQKGVALVTTLHKALEHANGVAEIMSGEKRVKH